jgi:hypothetical protein
MWIQYSTPANGFPSDFDFDCGHIFVVFCLISSPYTSDTISYQEPLMEFDLETQLSILISLNQRQKHHQGYSLKQSHSL